ncbi:metal-dependent hydrolase [Peribacillus cavernae]|uniref:Metal-dependent hydrolase n=1 Tax=Peribacillus cavernae TaxID=1674310 RepID=A0A433HRM0_9BACI|nr:metal-dependent hydrolase [Peribacillus cavernae]MDQ0218787.1 inner membrane protein [Peribacillus cavernae]RUQ30997.1 metal-dependent hydrolase [Peribacillus cavernae]
MDTITHTLFGLGLYKAVNKEQMSKKEKYALLFTTVGASQIPDIDVISQLWDSAGQYQMWHRGITHSVFLVPVWAFLFFIMNRFIFRIKSFRFFFIALIGVFIHDTSDIFNAWGTGYLEPFSSARLTLGTVSIVDFVIWFIFLLAFIVSKTRSTRKEYTIYRISWIVIALHIVIQSTQGYVLYEQYKNSYDEVALSARFFPWHFSVIGKNDATIDIVHDSVLSEANLVYRLQSSDKANLETLFAKNPEAKTLYQWSPFVVIVNNEERLGIYDPRFYQNGQSFLFEYIEKTQIK